MPITPASTSEAAQSPCADGKRLVACSPSERARRTELWPAPYPRAGRLPQIRTTRRQVSVRNTVVACSVVVDRLVICERADGCDAKTGREMHANTTVAPATAATPLHPRPTVNRATPMVVAPLRASHAGTVLARASATTIVTT